MDGLTRNAARSAFGLAGAAVVLAFGSLAAPAFAAAPSNDEVGGAEALSLGEHVSLDTTGATTTADDATLNDACGAPATDASVWYTFTAADDGGVVLDASSSDYSAGFMVFEGAPSPDSLINCGPLTIGLGTSAGTTYTVMVFDDQQDENGTSGGDLELDVNAAPPPPTVDMTVDPKATVDKSGTAWVTGSYTCTNGDNIEIDGELHQSVGRVTINGYGGLFDEGTCDGSPHAFSMGISGENGKFAGGRAASIVFSYACGSFDCADGYAE
ncbi:MAG TPA: hypothetical protein VFE07_05730, partial [Marmoricola sp.]|nr:hypothetical protein [Marmoricola sp.]